MHVCVGVKVPVAKWHSALADAFFIFFFKNSVGETFPLTLCVRKAELCHFAAAAAAAAA